MVGGRGRGGLLRVPAEMAHKDKFYDEVYMPNRARLFAGWGVRKMAAATHAKTNAGPNFDLRMCLPPNVPSMGVEHSNSDSSSTNSDWKRSKGPIPLVVDTDIGALIDRKRESKHGSTPSR